MLVIDASMALAWAQGLSSYDASYLELAQRLGASLASFDRRLNEAAQGWTWLWGLEPRRGQVLVEVGEQDAASNQ
jgi:hypothetical protein